MFWLYILIGVLVVVVGGGFIVCNMKFEVDEDFPRDKNGNIIFDKINDYI